MKIIFSSNRGQPRERLIEYVRAQKAQNRFFKVVDIGGAFYPWTAEITDTYVDINAMKGVDLIQGDIHDPGVWDEISRRNFAFCICSHVLEDIRDPLFVLARLREHFSHGYIATPNKHTEFNHIQSPAFVGYWHHRWIFTLSDGRLLVVAKFPLASQFSPRRRFIAQLKTSWPVQAIRKARKMSPRISDLGPLSWWDSQLAGHGNELSFVWSGDLEYKSINADYAGATAYETACLYHRDLANGL